MSFAETAALGAIAGLTIFLGLPFARMERVGTRARVGLAMLSVGILAFLFVDVTGEGFSLVSGSVEKLHHGGSLGPAIGSPLMFGGGLFAGIVGLTTVERRSRRERPLPPLAGGAANALSPAQADALAAFDAAAARAKALRSGLVIATA